MSEEFEQQAGCGSELARAYHQARPGYPVEALEWLVGAPPVSVLELGAGTGRFTDALAAAGHDVHATEPDVDLLALLRIAMPQVRTHESPAEEIPAPDRSVDVVVAAQAFGEFDLDRALPEIVRVLKPGGTLAVVWNESDLRIPWVKKMTRIINAPATGDDPHAALETSDLFEEPEHTTFSHWQEVQRATLVDLALSHPHVAALDDATRETLLADLTTLYDDYGRGMDGMQWPYIAHCVRVRAVPQPEPQAQPQPQPQPQPRAAADDVTTEEEGSTAHEPTVAFDVSVEPGMEDSAATLPRILGDLNDDSGLLLIDFR